jgi:chemotaxis signal transduction protein
LVNVRGGLVTVVDGHILLGQLRPAEAELAVLLLDRAGKVAGLTVGEVLDFLEVPSAAVAPREQLPGVDPAIVKAVGEWAGRRFVLLDLDALLAPLLGG